MSKTQEKRARRAAERDVFIKERRQVQLAVFESNFKVGLEFFEANKDKMSPEEIAQVEEEIEKNRKLIEEWKEKWDA
jgi:hypothetical protein